MDRTKTTTTLTSSRFFLRIEETKLNRLTALQDREWWWTTTSVGRKWERIKFLWNRVKHPNNHLPITFNFSTIQHHNMQCHLRDTIRHLWVQHLPLNNLRFTKHLTNSQIANHLHKWSSSNKVTRNYHNSKLSDEALQSLKSWNWKILCGLLGQINRNLSNQKVSQLLPLCLSQSQLIIITSLRIFKHQQKLFFHFFDLNQFNGLKLFWTSQSQREKKFLHLHKTSKNFYAFFCVQK